MTLNRKRILTKIILYPTINLLTCGTGLCVATYGITEKVKEKNMPVATTAILTGVLIISIINKLKIHSDRISQILSAFLTWVMTEYQLNS